MVRTWLELGQPQPYLPIWTTAYASAGLRHFIHMATPQMAPVQSNYDNDELALVLFVVLRTPSTAVEHSDHERYHTVGQNLKSLQASIR